MSFSVRKAQPTDANDLAAILEEARLFKVAQGDDQWGAGDEPFTTKEVIGMIAEGHMYIVLVDGKPAGTVSLSWDDEWVWGAKGQDSQAGYLHKLVLSNAFRGQNLGKEIIDWVREEVRRNNRSLLRLDCPATNRKLCAYYEKQDFKRTGTEDLQNYTAALYEQEVTKFSSTAFAGN